jgi:hypothetical protein
MTDRIRNQIMERLRARVGDAYVRANAEFIEAQWEYAVELGMLDPETDLASDTESS